MTEFLTKASIISIGLMIGSELAVWAFINPVLWQLEEQARAMAVRLFARKLGAVMPVWYVLNLILLISLVVLLRAQPVVWLVSAAAGIWVTVIVLTVMFLVPINNRLARQNDNISLEQAHKEHVRWDMLHRFRVIALGAAMALVLFAVKL